jgi:adenylyltransferase/sulfurtransferase
MLNQEEYKRYNRHIIMSEIGIEGQEKIKKSKVLVVGAGGLGSPVLLYLTAAGVGNIGIVEFDTVSETNLQRQILYNFEDIGKSKVEIALNKLMLQNPVCKFDIYDFPLKKTNALNVIKNYDIVVDCTDNFPTRFLINDCCAILNKPLIFGAIYKFEGQVSVFNYNNGPSYRCLVPEIPKQGEVQTCSEIGVVGVLPGIIGSIQASECLKVILGIGEILSGKIFVFDALNFSTNIITFEKSKIKITELTEYEDVCNVKTIKTKEIDAFELKQILEKSEDISIIDIREKEEFEEFNLGGINILEEEVLNETNIITKNKKVIFICKYGKKSEELITKLQNKNIYNNLYNLFGGINSYRIINSISIHL